ncbi:MAG TPA: acyl-CoA dehydrogenase family protein [Nakamurella sp.]
MMEGINLARVDAANCACGFLKAAIREGAIRTNNRIVFGKQLSELQTIQIKVGQMAADYEAARLLTLAASDALGKGGDPILLSKGQDVQHRRGHEARRASVGAAPKRCRSSARWASTTTVACSDYSGTPRPDRLFDGTSEIHTLMIGRSALRSYP